MKKILLGILIWLAFIVQSNAQTFTSTGGALPDLSTQCFSITPTGLPTTGVGLTGVCVNITHPSASDLILTLEAPDGTVIELSSNNGGVTANYNNVCFEAGAATNIVVAPTPLSGGPYHAECLDVSVANNSETDPNGLWRLCIQDNVATDAGTLVSWSLTFGPTSSISPIAGDDCVSAAEICSLDGYYGNTSGCYTAGGDPGTFCGSIENSSWLRFTVTATSIELGVDVTSCAAGDGIQMGIYVTNDCGTFVDGDCFSPVNPGANTLTFSGLTIGQEYYLLIDGWAGDICDYEITAVSGIQTLDVTTSLPPGENNICLGESVTIDVDATNADSYTWTSTPAGFTSSDASITVSPTENTTYHITVVGADNTCSATASASIDIIVNAPTISAQGPTTFCEGDDVVLQGDGLTQVFNGYTINSIPYALPFPTTGTALSLGDDASSVQNLGFTFDFWGTNFTQVAIASNGYLQFGASSSTFSNTALPTAGTPNGIFAFFWDDLNPGSAGSINYSTQGTAPNRAFVVNFIGVPHFASGGNTLTCQVVVYESTGIMEAYYTSAMSDGGSITIGTENGTGTSAVTLTGFNNTSPAAGNIAALTGTAIQIVPSYVTSTPIVWSPNGETTATITVSTAGTYFATIDGCETDPIEVTVIPQMELDLDNDGIDDAVDPSVSVYSCDFTIDALPLDDNNTGISYSWTSSQGGFVDPGTQTHTTSGIAPGSSATFTVTVDRGVCTQSSTITVNCPCTGFEIDLDDNSTADGGNVTINNCGSVSVDATPLAGGAADTYTWVSNDPAFVDPGTATITGATAPYFYEVTLDRGGCILVRRISITCIVSCTDDPDLGNFGPTTVSTCSDYEINATPTDPNGEPVTYSWDFTTPAGVTTTNISTSSTYTATEPGTYTVTVTRGLCVVTRSVTVEDNAPILTFASIVNSCDALVSNARPQNFSPSLSYTYTWINVATGATVGASAIFTTTEPGTYQVTVTEGTWGECESVRTVVYNHNASPDLSELPTYLETCNVFTYDATPANFTTLESYTYEFMDDLGNVLNADTSNPIFVFTDEGAYEIHVTRGDLCESVIPFEIVSNPPVLSLPTLVTSCYTVQVDGRPTNPQSGDSFAWTGPAGFTSSSAVINVSVPGTYELTVTRGTLCETTGSFVFELDTQPVIDLDLEYVHCDPLLVNADPTAHNPASVSYTWVNTETGVTLPFVTATALLEPGEYRVTASNGPLCEVSSLFYITCPGLELDAEYVNADSIIYVSWTDTSTVEIGYILERSLDPQSGVWQVVGTLAANSNHYNDWQIFPGRTYCYRIKYILPDGSYSAYSNIGCDGVPGIGINPSEGGIAPYEYHLMGEPGNQSVNLMWESPLPAHNIEYFEVYYGVYPANPNTRIGFTEETNFEVIGLINGVDYGFRVRAILKDGSKYDFSELVKLHTSIILSEDEEPSKFNVSVMPNPNAGVFEIGLSGYQTEKLNITIVSVSGQTVYKKSISGFGGRFNQSVRLNTLPNGMYMLMIETDKQTVHEKIIIQK